MEQGIRPTSELIRRCEPSKTEVNHSPLWFSQVVGIHEPTVTPIEATDRLGCRSAQLVVDRKHLRKDLARELFWRLDDEKATERCGQQFVDRLPYAFQHRSLVLNSALV
ncbi:MAG: hypothetical protein CMN27_00145 [Salinisphaera sp.]|nr:hypothetical protein [Salinisphaera sp.]